MTNHIDKNEISSKEYQIKLKSNNSLINLNHERKDIHGNVISKRYKTHRVTFIDQVEGKKPLSEIIIVESFKELNKESTMRPKVGFEYDDAAWNCILF
jgi:hypothetical protein